ncbi:MAG TPA: baseplate J/gp47 family protein, partial [Candidatus Hydrogenedentes bacterium]|nr:baseplate J/gp47 family protein [Candidatus Hydrogenedentota bacterium]
GGGLNPALETPQGQLASSQAAVIGDKNNEFALFVNQVDPQYSDGRFQDAIGRIYFLTRKPATATAVTATLTGLPGTVVPGGTLAQDTSGNTYACSADATIGVTGTVNAEFQNIQTGPIPCAAGTLTQVYQAVPGWDAITNAADGTMGSDVESRADFEYRRRNSVALNGKGTPQAIYAEVFALADVLDVYVKDNPKGDTVLVGSTDYPMLPHSVYVAVVGGADVDIAEAIWRKKDTGCDYNGNTSVTVTDDSGYNYPQPTYVVKFERPAALPVKFAVQLVNDVSLPSNIVALVKAAIIARFNGTDGTTRERIGSLILASRYYGAVVSAASNVSLISVLIGTSTPTLSQVSVGIDQKPTLSESDITVTLV